MLKAILRKAGQVAGDPVLRRWLLRRALGLTPGEPAFTPHRPPVLGPDWAGLAAETPHAVFTPLPEGVPRGDLDLRLPGRIVTVKPGDEAKLVETVFADPETQLGLHRFAWVPLMKAGDDSRWVGAVWRAWRQRFGTPDESWAWHPYTAAERAITLLTFAERFGLPGPAEDTLAVLAAHAPAIAARLEYFGEHHTSNHLFNNGRGLYLLGLTLDLPQAAATGAKIIRAEAARIFRPSGLLREASSHYHLLLTRSLASLWLAAEARGRPEAGDFEVLLRRAVAVLPHFTLPGRFPLIGDISPDCPPEHLAGLLPGGDRRGGWLGLLAPERRGRLADLLEEIRPAAPLVTDGWLRAEFGPWSGLWHAEPEGWSPMPGHGHQDCGGFELHFENETVFVDPGRGSYAVAGEADEFVSAAAHNGLSLDGADPYPANRPYYSPDFRRNAAGPARLEPLADGAALTYGGANRRIWRFGGPRLEITDSVAGRGRHAVTRRLHTTAAVESLGSGLRLTTATGRRFTIAVEGARLTVVPTTVWTAYGHGEPANRIEIVAEVSLPWSGRIVVEAG